MRKKIISYEFNKTTKFMKKKKYCKRKKNTFETQTKHTHTNTQTESNILLLNI